MFEIWQPRQTSYSSRRYKNQKLESRVIKKWPFPDWWRLPNTYPKFWYQDGTRAAPQSNFSDQFRIYRRQDRKKDWKCEVSLKGPDLKRMCQKSSLQNTPPQPTSRRRWVGRMCHLDPGPSFGNHPKRKPPQAEVCCDQIATTIVVTFFEGFCLRLVSTLTEKSAVLMFIKITRNFVKVQDAGSEYRKHTSIHTVCVALFH